MKSLDELNESSIGNVWSKEEAEHVEVYEVWYHAWASRIVGLTEKGAPSR